MSQRRSNESGRPRGSSDTTRPRMSQLLESPTSTSPTSPRTVRFTDDSASIKNQASTTTTSGNNTKYRPPRVIRTFEEIERIVPREEWYEELECGICSHILGAPQGLVPCGHSFCGPCAWTWIKVNGLTKQNHTCPHCRIPVNETIPLIPNIVVDQIIDRKLAGLPEGKEKEGHILERESKSADWKVLQSSIVPPKPAPAARRGRAMEAFTNLFEPMPYARRPGTGRRLIIGDPGTANFANGNEEVVDLEPDTDPRRRGVYAGLTLAEATRRGMEDDPTRHQSAARRLGTATNDHLHEQSLGGYAVPVASAGASGAIGTSSRPQLATRTSSTTSTLDQHSQRQRQWDVASGGGVGAGAEIGIARHARIGRPSLQVRTGSYQSTTTGGGGGGGAGDVRRSITTSRALMSRQDRYRTVGGSRDSAVLVDSDRSGEVVPVSRVHDV